MNCFRFIATIFVILQTLLVIACWSSFWNNIRILFKLLLNKIFCVKKIVTNFLQSLFQICYRLLCPQFWFNFSLEIFSGFCQLITQNLFQPTTFSSFLLRSQLLTAWIQVIFSQRTAFLLATWTINLWIAFWCLIFFIFRIRSIIFKKLISLSYFILKVDYMVMQPLSNNIRSLNFVGGFLLLALKIWQIFIFSPQYSL